MMLRIPIVLFPLLFSLVVYAQDPPPPDGLEGEDLRVWLRSNWFSPHHNSVGYNSARQAMYSDIDNEGGKVFCVYSGFNQDAAFTTFLNPINAEHTVPQQLFNSNEPMRSDVHHVFPTHMDVNSARGNLPFGDSPDATTDNWYIGDESDIFNISNIPSSDIDSYSERDVNVLFEPREDHKGDVARAVFYFYTMYPDEVGNISQLANINILQEWHLMDLPDSKEILRNEKVQELQGNYNPYISMPELVSIAWDLPSSLLELDYQVNVYPNPVQELITVHSPNLIDRLQLINMKGELVREVRSNELQVLDVEAGVYLLKVFAEEAILFEKILVQ